MAAVKIVMEFPTPEAAVVALAKLGDIKAASALKPVDATKAVDPVKAKRPPGRPPKDAAASISSAMAPRVAAEPAKEAAKGPAVEQPATEAKPVVEEPAKETAAEPADAAQISFAEDDCRASLQKVFEACGMASAQELLGRFGAQRLSQLPKDKYSEFMAAADAALADVRAAA